MSVNQLYITVPPGINTSAANITVSRSSTTEYSVSIIVPLLNTANTGSTYIASVKCHCYVFGLY